MIARLDIAKVSERHLWSQLSNPVGISPNVDAYRAIVGGLQPEISPIEP